MTKALDRFTNLVLTQLLPQFCDNLSRNYGRDGFDHKSIRISERDASDFLRAIDAGLVVHKERGLYHAPRSSVCEQFFWEGHKDKIPRPVTLWLEPIITVAVISRLHFDFEWPKDLIGTQSKDWAFDVVAYHSAAMENEYIACEVKKSVGELTQLIALMTLYGLDLSAVPSKMKPAQRNAYKKVLGLIRRKAPIFWAVGPDGASQVFKVSYESENRVTFQPADETVLRYS